jgi:UDP-glucuronate 4-epimerase
MENVLGKKAIKEMYSMQAGDVKQTFADTFNLKKHVNYTPEVDLKKGVKEFINWFYNYEW